MSKFKVGDKEDRMTYKFGDKVVVNNDIHKSKKGYVFRVHPATEHLRTGYTVVFDDGEYTVVSENSVFLVPSEPVNTVLFVTHDDDYNKKKYIFGIERHIRVSIGDKLFADTRYGKSVVTAVCEPFEISEHGLNQLSKIHGGYGKLKYITGRAVKSYTEEPFENELPF